MLKGRPSGSFNPLSTLGYMAAGAAANRISKSWQKYKARSAVRSRIAERRSRTATRTKRTTKKVKYRQTPAQHGDASATGCLIVLRKPMKLYKSLGKYTYTHVARGITNSTAGNQFAGDLNPLLDTQMFMKQTPESPTVVFPAYSFPQSLYEINPYRGVTGSQLITAGAYVDQNDRVYLESIRGSYQFVNLSNISCTMQLYLMVCKKSTMEAPTTLWGNILSQEQGTLPVAQQVAYNTTGFAAGTGNAVGSANDITIYGESPWRHKQFHEYWNCRKRFNIILEPGQSKKIWVTVRVNKVYDKNVLNHAFYNPTAAGGAVQNASVNATAVPWQFMPGMVQTMILQRGQLVGAASGGVGATFSDDVTISDSKIGWMSEMQYTVKAMPAATRSISWVYRNIPKLSGSQRIHFINDIDQAAEETQT